MDLDPPAPASSRGQKISMILIFAPLIDQISVPVLGGVVVSLVDAYTECKYGGPLGRPGTSSVEARLVSPQRGFSLFVLIVTLWLRVL